MVEHFYEWFDSAFSTSYFIYSYKWLWSASQCFIFHSKSLIDIVSINFNDITTPQNVKINKANSKFSLMVSSDIALLKCMKGRINFHKCTTVLSCFDWEDYRPYMASKDLKPWTVSVPNNWQLLFSWIKFDADLYEDAFAEVSYCIICSSVDH